MTPEKKNCITRLMDVEEAKEIINKTIKYNTMHKWNFEISKKGDSGQKPSSKISKSLPSYSNVLDDNHETISLDSDVKSLNDNWKYLNENKFLADDKELSNKKKHNDEETACPKEDSSSTGSSTSKNSIIFTTLESLLTLTDDEKKTGQSNAKICENKNKERFVSKTNKDEKSNIITVQSSPSLDYNGREFTNAIFEMTSHITNYLTPVRSQRNSSSFAGFTRLSKFCFNFYVEGTNTIGTASFETLNNKIIIDEEFRSDITLDNCLSSEASIMEKSNSEMTCPIQPKSNIIMYLNQPRCSEPSIAIVNKATVILDPNETYLSDTNYASNCIIIDTENRKRTMSNKRVLTEINKLGNGEAQEGQSFLNSLETPKNVHRLDNFDIPMEQFITNVTTDDIKPRSCAEEYRNPIISEVTVAIDVAVKKLEDTLLSRISQQIKEAINKLEQISDNNMKTKESYINSKESFNECLQCDLIGKPLVHLVEKGEQVFHYTEAPRSFRQMNFERSRENQAIKRQENLLKISDGNNQEVKVLIKELSKHKNHGENQKVSIFSNFLRYNFQVILLVTSFFVGIVVMYRIVNMLI